LQKIKYGKKKRGWEKIDLRDDEVDGHFFSKRKKIDDLKNCWERYSLEFLGFLNDAAAEKIGLRV